MQEENKVNMLNNEEEVSGESLGVVTDEVTPTEVSTEVLDILPSTEVEEETR